MVNALTPVTAQLDERTLATVSDLARWRGITDAEYIAEAVRRVAESEADYRAFIQEGIDAADRGELIPQAEMERWFEERVAGRRAA